jgi:hypothetical protein
MLEFCTLFMSLCGMKKFIFSLKLPEEIPQVGSAGVDLLTQNKTLLKRYRNQESWVKTMSIGVVLCAI